MESILSGLLTSSAVKSLVRHGITAGLAAATTKGWVDGDTAASLVPGLATIAMTIWGAIQGTPVQLRKRAAKASAQTPAG